MRGAILAGGEASRFGGEPKGLKTIGGIRILDRLVTAFQSALGSNPILIANHSDASSWHPGLTVVSDLRPGLGALGGLHTAVEAVPAPVVVVAWDMPFVPAGLIAALAHGLRSADACLPASQGPRGVEPMCAGYGPGCADPIRAALDAGERQAVGFHPRIKVSILTTEEVARFGDPSLLFFNINTAADLLEAESLWRKPGSSQ